MGVNEMSQRTLDDWVGPGTKDRVDRLRIILTLHDTRMNVSYAGGISKPWRLIRKASLNGTEDYRGRKSGIPMHAVTSFTTLEELENFVHAGEFDDQ